MRSIDFSPRVRSEIQAFHDRMVRYYDDFYSNTGMYDEAFIKESYRNSVNRFIEEVIDILMESIKN